MSAPDAQKWVRFAYEDLQAAKALLGLPNAYPRHACWLAQQSAEKSLKAALIYLQIEFPFTHDLDRLRELLPEGWHIKTEQPQLYSLSVWAVEARYPGDTPEAVEADARAALQQAEAVWQSIRTDLDERGLNS